ncbi:MAG TPA: ATP-binding protein [Bacillus bacterium]|nr:ATP-binding protein [Bacillus sp. (in: firmicutes)]
MKLTTNENAFKLGGCTYLEKGADITIVTGHFGSGKTEIAINLALEAKKKNDKVAVADLDIVNPYYRARDARAIFTEHGIELIAPAKKLASADLPIVPGDIYRVIYDPEYIVIVDAGGDKDGATALGQFYNDWKAMDPEVLFILNANRPYVSTLDGAVETLMKIEKASRLKISGILNNSNVGSQTTIEDVQNGIDLCKNLSKQLQIPLLMTILSPHLRSQADFFLPDHPFKPISRFLKLPWES